MESPTTIVKQAISPGTIIKGIVGTLVVFALFDLLGLTSWIITPVSQLRAKFARPTS